MSPISSPITTWHVPKRYIPIAHTCVNFTPHVMGLLLTQTHPRRNLLDGGRHACVIIMLPFVLAAAVSSGQSASLWEQASITAGSAWAASSEQMKTNAAALYETLPASERMSKSAAAVHTSAAPAYGAVLNGAAQVSEKATKSAAAVRKSADPLLACVVIVVRNLG